MLGKSAKVRKPVATLRPVRVPLRKDTNRKPRITARQRRKQNHGPLRRSARIAGAAALVRACRSRSASPADASTQLRSENLALPNVGQASTANTFNDPKHGTGMETEPKKCFRCYTLGLQKKEDGFGEDSAEAAYPKCSRDTPTPSVEMDDYLEETIARYGRRIQTTYGKERCSDGDLPQHHMVTSVDSSVKMAAACQTKERDASTCDSILSHATADASSNGKNSSSSKRSSGYSPFQQNISPFTWLDMIQGMKGGGTRAELPSKREEPVITHLDEAALPVFWTGRPVPSHQAEASTESTPGNEEQIIAPEDSTIRPLTSDFDDDFSRSNGGSLWTDNTPGRTSSLGTPTEAQPSPDGCVTYPLDPDLFKAPSTQTTRGGGNVVGVPRRLWDAMRHPMKPFKSLNGRYPVQKSKSRSSVAEANPQSGQGQQVKQLPTVDNSAKPYDWLFGKRAEANNPDATIADSVRYLSDDHSVDVKPCPGLTGVVPAFTQLYIPPPAAGFWHGNPAINPAPM